VRQHLIETHAAMAAHHIELGRSCAEISKCYTASGNEELGLHFATTAEAHTNAANDHLSMGKSLQVENAAGDELGKTDFSHFLKIEG